MNGLAGGAVGGSRQGRKPPQIDGFAAVQALAIVRRMVGRVVVQPAQRGQHLLEFVGGMVHLGVGDRRQRLFRCHVLEIRYIV